MRLSLAILLILIMGIVVFFVVDKLFLNGALSKEFSAAVCKLYCKTIASNVKSALESNWLGWIFTHFGIIDPERVCSRCGALES